MESLLAILTMQRKVYFFDVYLSQKNYEDKYEKTGNCMIYNNNENCTSRGCPFAIPINRIFKYVPRLIEKIANDEVQPILALLPDDYRRVNQISIKSKGNLKDHYYYQMVSFIRRFKGVSEQPKVSNKVTIDIYSNDNKWDDVIPYYAAYPGNTFARDAKGYGNLRFKQDTGINDITGAKVARDNEYIYFMVETASDITQHTGLRLLIDVENKNSTDTWESFEYIVNRINSNNKTVLERSTGGWNWEKVSEVD